MVFLPCLASGAVTRCSALGVEVGTKTFVRAWRHHALSTFNGVSWSSRHKKFQANVSFEGISYHAGCFNCEVEAAHAYDDFLRQLCPTGARLKKSLNFPSLPEASFEESLQDVRARALAGAATLAKEEESFTRLHTLFSATPQALTHEIIRVSGSSRVDALFRLRGCDSGLPLQVKAASASGNSRRSYAYSNTRHYDGMLLLLIALDRDIMWAIPGSAVGTTSFTIRLDSERDGSYRVSDLGSALEQHFQYNTTMTHICLKQARLWCADRHQVEERTHLQMADLFASASFRLEKDHRLPEVDSVLVGGRLQVAYSREVIVPAKGFRRRPLYSSPSKGKICAASILRLRLRSFACCSLRLQQVDWFVPHSDSRSV